MSSDTLGSLFKAMNFVAYLCYTATGHNSSGRSSYLGLTNAGCLSPSYASYPLFVPMIPGIFLLVLPIKISLWVMASPIIGQMALILKTFRAEPLTLIEVTLATSLTLGLGLICILAAVRLYETERILFSK